MTLSQTSVSADAEREIFGEGAYRGEVTLFPISTRHTVSSVSSLVSSTATFVWSTSTSGFVAPPSVEAEAEWQIFQFQKHADPAYEPAQTPLGAELRRLRAKIIESGEPLLSWEEIEKEVAERRGGAR